MLSNLIAAVRASVRKFGHAQGGNVAIIFGIAAVPVVLAVGGFIDYQRATVARAQMQDALDATALALHTSAATMTQTQMNDFATKYFAANFVNADALNVNVLPKYDASGPTVTVDGTATVNMTFLPLIGIKKIDIGAQAVTTWGQARLRVALVLDNTGSMADDGKMAALQTATKNLIGQLKAVATNPGDVYVSIIPFSKDVNVGASVYNQGWINWGLASDVDPTKTANDSLWDGANGTCTVSSKKPRSTCLKAGACSISSKTTQSTCESAAACSISTYTTQSTCQAAGTCSISTKTTKSTCEAAGTCSISTKTTQSTCQSAGICSISRWTTQSTCQSHSGTWSMGVWTVGVWTAGVWSNGVWTAGVWTPKAHSTWNGCIMDRDQDYDVKNTAPTALATDFPAEQYSSCPSEMTGLTYDWDALDDIVDGMVPNGNTNQGIGLAWGWQSLTQSPFTIPAYDPVYQYKQIVILLTDGLNTQNRWSTSASTIDAREETACAAIKAANMTIYAIQVNTGGDPTQQVLEDCASTSDKFFLLTTADQIITTFDEIGKALSDLRLKS